jgi:hypothetical protein
VKGQSEESFAARVQEMGERTMVGRTGRPEDIADAIAFLDWPGIIAAAVEQALECGHRDLGGESWLPGSEVPCRAHEGGGLGRGIPRTAQRLPRSRCRLSPPDRDDSPAAYPSTLSFRSSTLTR